MNDLVLQNLPSSPPEGADRKEIEKKTKKLQKRLFQLQNLLFAEGKYALLVVLQGMDTSGKDGTVRHVFSCMNPMGVQVKSFKAPTEEEKKHDFLWRVYPKIPAKGMIHVFNRSHYEDILVPTVHKSLDMERIDRRYQVINDFENHLKINGTTILKIFLHISHQEQKARIEKRLNDPEKRWKYDISDTQESKKWDQYQAVYQRLFNECNQPFPWIAIPSDKKWYRNYLIADLLVKTLESFEMKYPTGPQA